MKKTLIVLLITFSIPVFSQWIQTQGTPQGSGITGMVTTSYPNDRLLVTTGSVSGGQSGGIRMSINGGGTWENRVNCYIARTIANAPAGYEHILYASCWFYPASNEGIYRSTNSGSEWEPIFNFPAAGNNIFSILNPEPTLIYAGTRTGILRSTDYGATFSYSNNGIPANSWVWDIASDSSGGVVAAATTNGLFISTNLGDSWQQTTGIPVADTVTCISFYTTNSDDPTFQALVGTDNGKVYRGGSITGFHVFEGFCDLGDNNYIEKIISSPQFSKIAVEHFAATRPRNPAIPGGGMDRILINGSFTQMNEGLPVNPNVSDMFQFDEETGLILTVGLFNNANNGAQVYKRTVPIGIHSISNEVPKGFSLGQNYPNPFNPNTKIKFQITKLSAAKLVVFDALGREIETLVNEQLRPGTYEVDFDGGRLSSGVYYYKLFADEFAETKKMILVK